MCSKQRLPAACRIVARGGKGIVTHYLVIQHEGKANEGRRRHLQVMLRSQHVEEGFSVPCQSVASDRRGGGIALQQTRNDHLWAALVVHATVCSAQSRVASNVRSQLAPGELHCM